MAGLETSSKLFVAAELKQFCKQDQGGTKQFLHNKIKDSL